MTLFEKLVWTLAVLLFFILSFASLSIDGFNPVIDSIVQSKLAMSGANHDVTAVLLNFRSLDTMLEVGVILLALVAIYTISPHFRYKPLSFSNNMTDTYVALVFPPLFLIALYILNIGTYKSGGAFQAAALMAGGVIIIKLVKPQFLSNIKERMLKFAYVFGLFFFILVGLATMFNGAFLYYPKEYAYLFILAIETFLTLSLGAILAAFFIIGVHRFKA